jgi:O-antigen ligase
VRAAGSFVQADRLGLLLAAGLAGWTLVSWMATGADGGDAALVVGLIGLVAGAYAIGRAAAARIAWLPAAAVAAVALVALLPPIAGRSGRSAAGALGYSNASAELSVQGFAAALLVVLVVGRRAWAFPAALAAVALAIATIRSGSTAAAVLLVLPVAALAAAAAGRPARPVLLALAAVLVAVLAGTVFLGASGGGGGADDRSVSPVIDATLSGRRIELWHDALVLMVEHPVVGVGPGRFGVESPTALADRDARWAHNGFLQLGAETGIVGLVLLLGIFVWALARPDGLGFAPGALAGSPALVAGAAVAALGIHACVDYVLHYPVLPVAAAAILGSAVPLAHRSEGAS